MHNFPCPRCQAHSITFKDKFRADLWIPIFCSNCGAKLTALPILLGLLHGVYVWNVLWLYATYTFDLSVWWYPIVVVEWVVFELLSIWYMPLAVLRSAPRQ